MGLIEIIVLGVALSADAFAVTISNTFTYAADRRRRLLLMPIMFGLFQGLMPVLGYFLGGLAAELIETYSGIVTLVILGFIGGSMIRDGLSSLRGDEKADEDKEGELGTKHLTFAAILVQAVATAIDAFAVGVSLRAQSVNILEAAVIIALTTALLCVVAVVLGRKVGNALGDRAQVAGGVVLVIIGLKALLS